MQRTQFDRRLFGRDDQIGRALLVAQKQILGMAAGNGTAQLARFLDREYRRMGDGLVRDPKRVQIGEKFVRRGGHQSFDSAGRAGLQRQAPFKTLTPRRKPGRRAGEIKYLLLIHPAAGSNVVILASAVSCGRQIRGGPRWSSVIPAASAASREQARRQRRKVARDRPDYATSCGCHFIVGEFTHWP